MPEPHRRSGLRQPPSAAPRLFNHEPERLAPVLDHELSHLHLGQRIGHSSPAVSVWFHEGLASHAARGGGAGTVAEEFFSELKAMR